MKKKKGFTLVELLVVIIIIGLLIALTTVSVVTIRKKQEVQNRKNTINSILTAAKAYVADHPEKLDLLDYNSYVPIHINDLIDSDYLSIDKNTYNTLVFDGGVEKKLDFEDTSLFNRDGVCYGEDDEFQFPGEGEAETIKFKISDACKTDFFTNYHTYIYKYNGYYGPEKKNSYRAVHIEKCKDNEGNEDKTGRVEYFIYDQKADIDKLTYSDVYYSEFSKLKEEKYNKIKYSDCGCKKQESGPESEEMCTEVTS